MAKEPKKKAVDMAKEVEKPPYERTPAQVEAVAAYKAARRTCGPRLRVVATGRNSAVGADHPDETVGALALMRAIGTTDFNFSDGLICQHAETSRKEEASQSDANFMPSVVKGFGPRDQIEAMLAAQMAAVHMASMTFARRLAHVENIPQQDSAERAFNKLARTFTAQVEALKQYRSKGEQKMTVQHVPVAEGGQAIVGNVNAPTEGVGARKKSENQPHARGYASGVEMPRRIESKRSGLRAAHRQCGGLASAGCMAPAAGLQWQQERPEAWLLHRRGDRDAAHNRHADETGGRADR
jgi:hypothetical protein